MDIDYCEKHRQIKKANSQGASHLEAGVVLLLGQKTINGKSEYIFQLIKRSSKVAQAGDISCPGGMLLPGVDDLFSILLKTGFIPAMREYNFACSNPMDKKTRSLIYLYLANALREAREEIGLNPYNVSFLGALPSYSLTSFTRTIFPVVCFTRRPFKYKLNEEVEKVLEIPLSFFYESANYAWLQVTTPEGSTAYDEQSSFPCLVIPDNAGNHDILWGATFQIIINFLEIIYGSPMPTPYTDKKFQKSITESYLSSRH